MEPSPASTLRIADPNAARLNAEAMQAMAGRRLAEAKRLLQEGLALDSSYAPLWLNLAAIQRAENDLAGALASVEAALKIDPMAFPALLMRGSLLDAQGSQREAARAYSIALTRLPPADRLDESMRRTVERAIAVSDSFAAELAFQLDKELRPDISGGSAASTRRMNHFLDHLSGRRRPYWPQPTNFFYPGLPAIEFYDREDFPWIAMVEAATSDVRGELLALLGDNEAAARELEPYMQRPDDQPVQQWGKLNNSLDWSAYHFAYMGKLYDEHRRTCPKTAALLDQVPFPVIQNRSPAALFSILQPKTHIPAHTGAGNVRLLCHLPLVLPPDCRFRVGNSVRAWHMGEALVFDDTLEHEAWNDSDQVRAVLIFDIWHPHLSPEERDFISRSLASVDAFMASGSPP